MNLDSNLQQPDNQAEWFCLRTQTKREHIAAAILSKIDEIEVFCPRISQVKKTRVGKKRFVEAMFPGYIFAKFSILDNYRRVIHTQGVSKLVQQGERKALPESLIRELQASVPDGIIEAPDLSVEPGAEIEFISGSLKGLNGKVLAQLPSAERIKILLKILGQEITVEVNSDTVILATEN